MEMVEQENLRIAKSGGLEQLSEQPNHKHKDVKSTNTRARKTMIAAGVLNIVSGTTFLAMAFFSLIYINPLLSTTLSAHRGFTSSVSALTAGMLFVPAVLGITSGIFTLKNKRWWLDFVVSIVLLLPVFSTGASILLVQARRDWSKTRRILIGSILGLAGCFTLLIWVAVAFS
jgi:hypothetical protein